MALSNRVEKFRDPAKLTQKISWPAESPPARGDFSLCPLPKYSIFYHLFYPWVGLTVYG